jgi:hypothetical protein
MDPVYAAILQTQCPWDDKGYQQAYQMYIGTIMAAKSPLSMSALQALHHTTVDAIEGALSPISSLLSSLDPSRPIEILHLSLQEFLTIRAERDQKYQLFYLNRKRHSQQLATLCLRLLNTTLNANTFGAHFLQNDNPGVPVIRIKRTPYLKRYGMQHNLWLIISLIPKSWTHRHQ